MSPAPERLSRIHAWFGALSPLRAGAVAAGAGGLAALGYAPLFLAPLFAAGLVALVWLLDAAMDRPRRLRAFFWRAWCWGAGHVLVGMHWIASPFMVEPDSWGVAWAVPAVIAFAAGLALFYGAGAALAAPFWTRDVRRIPVIAVALTLSELARGHLFTGFPWNLPAYVWEAGTPISQAAAFVGAYGLTAITLLIAAAPASVADSGPGMGRRFAPTLAAALVFGLIWGAGQSRIARAPVVLPGETPVVRVTDSGMTQAEKWTRRTDQEWRVLARYLSATGSADESRASIVIWPEGAIPAVNFVMLENPEFLAAIGRGLGDRALIAGFARRAPAGETLVWYNSAGLIDGVAGETRVGQIYDKHHLVPFGEYIPFWPAVRATVQTLNRLGVPIAIAPLQQIGEGFEPGAPPTRLIVPEAPPVVVLICYEAIFPGMTPRGAERPGWIAVVTNDAWFGGWSGPQQHFNIARYRSIEEGLPMARAASGGVSGIVDGLGRAVRATDRAGGFAEAQLPRALPETPFSRWGFMLTMVLIGAIAALRLAPLGAGKGIGS